VILIALNNGTRVDKMVSFNFPDINICCRVLVTLTQDQGTVRCFDVVVYRPTHGSQAAALQWQDSCSAAALQWQDSCSAADASWTFSLRTLQSLWLLATLLDMAVANWNFPVIHSQRVTRHAGLTNATRLDVFLHAEYCIALLLLSMGPPAFAPDAPQPQAYCAHP
jgi:hypothetical protein